MRKINLYSEGDEPYAGSDISINSTTFDVTVNTEEVFAAKAL